MVFAVLLAAPLMLHIVFMRIIGTIVIGHVLMLNVAGTGSHGNDAKQTDKKQY